MCGLCVILAWLGIGVISTLIIGIYLEGDDLKVRHLAIVMFLSLLGPLIWLVWVIYTKGEAVLIRGGRSKNNMEDKNE